MYINVQKSTEEYRRVQKSTEEYTNVQKSTEEYRLSTGSHVTVYEDHVTEKESTLSLCCCHLIVTCLVGY